MDCKLTVSWYDNDVRCISVDLVSIMIIFIIGWENMYKYGTPLFNSFLCPPSLFRIFHLFTAVAPWLLMSRFIVSYFTLVRVYLPIVFNVLVHCFVLFALPDTSLHSFLFAGSLFRTFRVSTCIVSQCFLSRRIKTPLWISEKLTGTLRRVLSFVKENVQLSYITVTLKGVVYASSIGIPSVNARPKSASIGPEYHSH